jgi:hypothetical protein
MSDPSYQTALHATVRACCLRWIKITFSQKVSRVNEQKLKN